MRIFLEIYEEQSEEDVNKGIPQQFIRVDVSELSDEEIISKKNEIAGLFGFRKYKAYKHICYHDESELMPCEIEEI